MSKYKNVKTWYNGVLFDSIKEAKYCEKLDMLKNAIDPKERVLKYVLQPKFKFVCEGKRIFNYSADFWVYYADGSNKVIDVKGFRTAVFNLKKKLIEAQYKITIELR